MGGIIFIKCLFFFLNFDETFLVRNSFVQSPFATDYNTVASVEPETERQGDSCANAIRSRKRGLRTLMVTDRNQSNKSLLFINIQSIKMKFSFDTWAQEGAFQITINIK